MSVTDLDFAEPFFSVKYVVSENRFPIGEKSIVLNLAKEPIAIARQGLGFFKSTVVANFTLERIERCFALKRLGKPRRDGVRGGMVPEGADRRLDPGLISDPGVVLIELENQVRLRMGLHDLPEIVDDEGVGRALE